MNGDRRLRRAGSRQGFPAISALATAVALAAGAATPALAAEPAHASPWVTEQTARARIVAGGVGEGAERRIYAGVEIALDPGWKTYWRNPGSSGVPPRIDWEKSENLAAAELLFPAPIRFKDRDGDTIGYKDTVVLPVRVTPKDPSKPIMLRFAAEFGICREVCIPVQPSLSLAVPPDASGAAPGAKLAAAIARVPRREATGPNVPAVKRLEVDLAQPKPRILLDVAFPGTASGGDVFLEAPEGIWIPLAKPLGRTPDGLSRFEVDLTDGADIADLKSRTILVTLVSEAGQAETAFNLE